MPQLQHEERKTVARLRHRNVKHFVGVNLYVLGKLVVKTESEGTC